MKKDHKKQQDRENFKAWFVSFNEFNVLLAGAALLIGIGFFLLRMLGYDIGAFF